MLKKGKLAAFTLLEALVALLVISGGLLVFQAMTKLLASEIQYQEQTKAKEWLLFADQLDAELFWRRIALLYLFFSHGFGGLWL